MSSNPEHRSASAHGRLPGVPATAAGVALGVGGGMLVAGGGDRLRQKHGARVAGDAGGGGGFD